MLLHPDVEFNVKMKDETMLTVYQRAIPKHDMYMCIFMLWRSCMGKCVYVYIFVNAVCVDAGGDLGD
jgi:hypothetical protein